MGIESKMKKAIAVAMMMDALEGKGYNTPVSHYAPRTPSKGEAKKCKSCKHFPCPESKEPMRIACGNHERRKK